LYSRGERCRIFVARYRALDELRAVLRISRS
jgi:hypothetical protein